MTVERIIEEFNNYLSFTELDKFPAAFNLEDTKMNKQIEQHYPSDQWNVHIETNASEIRKLLDSRTVTCWGQGPIADTGYYQLATTSAQSRGDKRLAIIATVADVKAAK